MSVLTIIAFPLLIIFIAIVAVSLFLHFVPLGLWISAMAAGVSVGIVNLTRAGGDLLWYLLISFKLEMPLRRVWPADEKLFCLLSKPKKAGLGMLRCEEKLWRCVVYSAGVRGLNVDRVRGWML